MFIYVSVGFRLRLGLVTGPQQLVEKIELHMQVSVLHTSSMSQVREIILVYENVN